jgi:hypothetical protein
LEEELADRVPSDFTFNAAVCPQPLPSAVKNPGAPMANAATAGALDPADVVTTSEAVVNSEEVPA